MKFFVPFFTILCKDFTVEKQSKIKSPACMHFSHHLLFARKTACFAGLGLISSNIDFALNIIFLVTWRELLIQSNILVISYYMWVFFLFFFSQSLFFRISCCDPFLLTFPLSLVSCQVYIFFLQYFNYKFCLHIL